jgi:putative metalloprotease
MTMFRKSTLFAGALAIAIAACGGGSRDDGDGGSGRTQAQAQDAPRAAPVSAEQAKRIQAIMIPLIRQMDNPKEAERVKVTLWADPHINAANGGDGDFYITTGLLQKANDDQLRAILAHEIAHEDLGHVAKTQTLATGVGLGIALLDQIFPGSAALTPIAGQLVVSSYSRKEEGEADAHGVTLLKRAGFDGKNMMANTLTWLQSTEGGSSGGFFATHPATEDRIAAVRRLP